MSRATIHRCYHCGKSIGKGSLVVEMYDGFAESCHRTCWRDAKDSSPIGPVAVTIVEEVPEKIEEPPQESGFIVSSFNLNKKASK